MSNYIPSKTINAITHLYPNLSYVSEIGPTWLKCFVDATTKQLARHMHKFPKNVDERKAKFHEIWIMMKNIVNEIVPLLSCQ